MFDFSEQLEKALKSLGEAVPSFCRTLYLIAFRPARLAYLSVIDADTPFKPRLFLAIAVLSLSKISRVAIFAFTLVLTVFQRSCSGDTYPADEEVIAAYARSQTSWPSTEQLLLAAVPIVMLVLFLSWLFEHIRCLKSESTPAASNITSALCYTVGAQCVLVTLITGVALLAVMTFGVPALEVHIIRAGLLTTYTWVAVPVLLLIVWPCSVYYRYLWRVYELQSFPSRHFRGLTQLALVSTGLVGAILPITAVIGPAYLFARRDIAVKDPPQISAALESVLWDKPADSANVTVRILNNESHSLLLRGVLVMESAEGEYYCGLTTSTHGIEIAPRTTGLLSARLKLVLGGLTSATAPTTSALEPPAPTAPNTSLAATAAAVLAGIPASSVTCSLPEIITDRRIHNPGKGRVWVDTYSFDGKEDWISANLKSWIFSRDPTAFYRFLINAIKMSSSAPAAATTVAPRIAATVETSSAPSSVATPSSATSASSVTTSSPATTSSAPRGTP
jgi:hypothetical protein